MSKKGFLDLEGLQAYDKGVKNALNKKANKVHVATYQPITNENKEVWFDISNSANISNERTATYKVLLDGRWVNFYFKTLASLVEETPTLKFICPEIHKINGHSFFDEDGNAQNITLTAEDIPYKEMSVAEKFNRLDNQATNICALDSVQVNSNEDRAYLYIEDIETINSETIELPYASSNKYGVMKVGSNLTVSDKGVVSVTKDNITSALGYTPSQSGGGDLSDYYTKTEVDRNFVNNNTFSNFQQDLDEGIFVVNKAENATRAEEDENGNVIIETYATKEETYNQTQVNNLLAQQANALTTEFNVLADGKLDKDTTNDNQSKVYVKKHDGSQGMVRYTSGAVINTIPYRDKEDGNFFVSDLTDTSDGKLVANKNYVDTVSSTKLDKDTSTTSNPKVYFKEANGNNVTKNTTPSIMPWSMPYRDGNSNFKVGDITSDSDGSYVANKNYVDNQIADVKEHIDNEEHAITDMFSQRITASDSTNSKYEIFDGSIAKLKKIGGMTYKNENLIVLDDVAETTVKGVTYSIKDGVISLNGTPTSANNLWIPLKKSISKGTVSYRVFASGSFAGHNGEVNKYSGIFIGKAENDYTNRFNTYVNDAGKTVTVDYDMGYLFIYWATGYSFTNAIFKPMLVSGSVIPDEYEPYLGFDGLANASVSSIVSEGNNLLDDSKLIIRGSDYTISDDGYISSECSAWNGKCFNSQYNAEASTVQSLNGIPLKKGDYYASFKAKINSGSGDLNALFITVPSKKQIPANKIAFPNMSSEYQTYKASFTLEEDCEIGFHIQVNGSANAMIFQVKDLMVANGDIEYEPYWSDRIDIPSAVQALEGYGLGINETYYNYIDFERKVFVQNVMELELNGSQSKSTFTLRSDPYVYAQLDISMSSNALRSSAIHISLSNSLTVKDANIWTAAGNENTFAFINSNTVRILFDGTLYTTAEELNAYLQENPVKIIYPLETPIETDISDLLTDSIYKVDNLGTETLVNEYCLKAPSEIAYSVSLSQQIIENSDNIAKVKDTKLDKVTDTGGTIRVYAVTAAGNQTTYRMSHKQGAYEVIVRDANGQAEVSNISSDSGGYMITNKNYVDGVVSNKLDKTTTIKRVYGTDENGNQTQLQYHQNANNYALALRDGTGNFKVSDLTNSSDGSYVANKNYVDTKIAEASIGGGDIPTLKTIGGTSLVGSGNITEFENMYRFDGNDGNIGFGFTDAGDPCIKNKNGNYFCFTNTEYDDEYKYYNFPPEGGNVVVKNQFGELCNIEGIHFRNDTDEYYTGIEFCRMGDEFLIYNDASLIALSDPRALNAGDYMHYLYYPSIDTNTGEFYEWHLPSKSGTIALTTDIPNDYYTKTEVNNLLAQQANALSTEINTLSNDLIDGRAIVGEAVHAQTADTANSADRATKDGSGNTITSTYATKTEVNQSTLFTLLQNTTVEANNYVDIQSYLNTYNELMIIVRSVASAAATVGASTSTSGTTFAVKSSCTGSSTFYSKINIQKTSNNYWAYELISTNGYAVSWQSSTTCRYIRNYIASGTCSMTVVIHGR